MGLFDSKRSKSALAKDRKYFNASEKHEVDYATTFKRKKKTYDTFDNGGGVDEIQWTARAENTQTGEVVWFTDNIDAKTKQEAWDKAGSAIDWKNPEWRGFVLYDVKPNNPSELMKNGGGLKNPIESLPTSELAKKAGVTMADMNKHNLGREDLIAMITEGSYGTGGGVGESVVYIPNNRVDEFDKFTEEWEYKTGKDIFPLKSDKSGFHKFRLSTSEMAKTVRKEFDLKYAIGGEVGENRDVIEQAIIVLNDNPTAKDDGDLYSASDVAESLNYMLESNELNKDIIEQAIIILNDNSTASDDGDMFNAGEVSEGLNDILSKYKEGGFLGGLFKSKRSKSALSKDRKYYNASQEHEVQYAKSTGRNKKPYDSNDGRTYKKGLSYKLDRAKHNKSEDWEKPMSQRKSRFYNGGGVENSYVIRAKSGEFVTVGKNNEVARSGLGNNHNYATLFKSEKEANDVIEKINNEAPFPINPKTDKNIVLYAEKYQPTKYSNGGGVNDSDLEFRNGGTYTTNRITSRDEAVESFLTQSKPFSYTNISVNFTPDGKGFLFQYGTLIAKRTDDSVSINEVFYSKTTSILQNLIGRKASEKGMKVSKVTFLENGGGVEDKDWKDLAWERNAPYIRLALEKNASKIGERFNFHKDFGWNQYGENFSTQKDAEIVAEQVKEKFKGDDGRIYAEVVVVEFNHQPDVTKYAITEYKVLYREENFAQIGDFNKRVYSNGGGVDYGVYEVSGEIFFVGEKRPIRISEEKVKANSDDDAIEQIREKYWNKEGKKISSKTELVAYIYERLDINDEYATGGNIINLGGRRSHSYFRVRPRTIANRAENSNMPEAKIANVEWITTEYPISFMEEKLGRKINSWKDDVITVEGMSFKKCYLRPYYELIK